MNTAKPLLNVMNGFFMLLAAWATWDGKGGAGVDQLGHWLDAPYPLMAIGMTFVGVAGLMLRQSLLPLIATGAIMSAISMAMLVTTLEAGHGYMNAVIYLWIHVLFLSQLWVVARSEAQLMKET